MIFNINEDYHINTFFSGKDIYLNFKKWKQNKINKLFIIGLSGSGKSTLSRKLAKEYNCDYIDTDKFRGNIYYSDEELQKESPYVYEYFTNVWEHGDRHNIQTMDPKIRRLERDKFIYWLINKPEKMIIEGAAIESVLGKDEKLRYEYPIIFKGTSMLKSMSRMLGREFTREHPGRNFIDTLLWIIKWCTQYNNMTNKHNEIRDKIINGFDYDDYEEIEENVNIYLWKKENKNELY